MPRGVPAKTKREKIERLLKAKWSKKRIIKAVGCHEVYYYQIKQKYNQEAHGRGF
jgi:hypothetical protein